MSGIQIDFIRHGLPEGGRMYRGSGVDDALSETGWQQMWRAVGEGCHWDAIVSSPLRRCLDFAQAVARKHNLPLRVEKDFREVGFGAWEGLTPGQIAAEYPHLWSNFHADPVRFRPEQAEDLERFGKRVAEAFEALLEEDAQRLLIVSHAGVIRAALGYVMQSPPGAWYRVKVNNAGISRFQHDRNGLQLVFHNRSDLP